MSPSATTPKHERLLAEYARLLNLRDHSRRPNTWDHRIDECEDKLLAIAERTPSLQDAILPVLEARYRDLGFLAD